MKKKFYKRILAFIISFVLSVNMPLCGYMASYADGIASYDPALIPLYALVTSIAVATGIVGKNVLDASNQLISNVINEIKYNEVLKATSDNTYNSPYRVIGSNGQPEKPNNNNKNGKWFALGAASSLGAAVAFEKGAVKEIADTLNDLGAYNPMQGSLGIISVDAFKTQSTASNVALQLANISNSCVTQFDQFLHSSFWDDKDFTPDDCLFMCNVDVSDLIRETPRLPAIYVNVIKKNDNIRFLDLTNCFGYYTYSNAYGSLSYYYANNTGYVMTLLNENQQVINTNVDSYVRYLYPRTSDQAFSFANIKTESTARLKAFIGYGSNTRFAYAGYKWQQETPWQYTNNVYNAGDTIINQYPDWDQSSINLLGEQIDALRIGLQSLTDPWNATQDQIQQGLSPEQVISQILNNYLNPENAPDPQPNPNPDPNPDPDPDPDPNPDPEPYPKPITFPQLEEAGQSVYDWVTTKITLPDGIFDKIPFSIPYDLYLLFRSMFPTNNRRTLLRVANNDTVVQNPSYITISSTFEAAGKSTRTYSENTWEKTAPVINLDLHFKYHDVSGTEKQIDIVKTVDLKPYSYFAMILYIMIYITWIFNILGWISSSFH